MTKINTPSIRVLAVLTVLAETIRDLKQIPSGVLYSQLTGRLNLKTYQTIIDKLCVIGIVKLNPNHQLVWLGRGLSYQVTKTGEKDWSIDGFVVTSIEEACAVCDACDALRGSTWNLGTRNEIYGALRDQKIGTTQTVNPPRDEDEEK
jgi:hypothetical protein